MEVQMEDNKKTEADEKFIKETPIEEINKLIYKNKLVFVGIKAINAWKQKQKENE